MVVRYGYKLYIATMLTFFMTTDTTTLFSDFGLGKDTQL